MKLKIVQIISLSIPLLLPFSGNGAELGSRQRTILPIAIPPSTPTIYPSNVSQYASSGYGSWQWGSGTNEGRQYLTPTGTPEATNQARLLSFFSLSDIHITDKESPAEVPYLGWSACSFDDGWGGLNHAAYSPVILDTTHHLDAAVKTINAMHRLTPFDFGVVLGDNGNAFQFNELRWFIEVMDGQYITPSSGTNAGANAIDYQMPFQAAGIDRSIPWYEAIGNHDQFWMGIGYPTEKIRQAMVGTNVLNISTNGPLIPPGSEGSGMGSEGSGMYVGVVDGTTPFGNVIEWGLTNLFDTPPTVAADTNRHSLTTDVSWPTNYINEFFNTASSPPGHGFNLANTGSLAACYTFEPLTNLPLKVIVLDDTCKSNQLDQASVFYGGGWVDGTRYAWLTNDLQKGQDAGQLMIIATHIPINPQSDLFDTNRVTGFYDTQTETNLIATFHHYPNLILLMAGHRHKNVVTPHPSPDPNHPEYGFWQVETASLRDFPRQFRTWEILRNSDNSISILTTCVDPVVETNSPAWKSIGYAVGAFRIFGNGAFDDTSSHTYNAELVEQLTAAMQAKIAGLGEPLGHQVAIDRDGNGVTIHFLGELQSADTLSGPWNDVTNISPCTLSATNIAKFYRAPE
jgi:metallophosphoesterase (TIGR03768 family)